MLNRDRVTGPCFRVRPAKLDHPVRCEFAAIRNPKKHKYPDEGAGRLGVFIPHGLNAGLQIGFGIESRLGPASTAEKWHCRYT